MEGRTPTDGNDHNSSQSSLRLGELKKHYGKRRKCWLTINHKIPALNNPKELELSLNVIIPPTSTLSWGRFWSQNGEWFSKGSLDKIVSTDRPTDGQTDMKIAYAQLHIHTNTV